MEQATNVHVEVGAMFANKNQLKAACQMFATHENFEYKVLKSDKSRMIIQCIGEGCSWHPMLMGLGGRMVQCIA
jgi:MuDR family transposase